MQLIIRLLQQALNGDTTNSFAGHRQDTGQVTTAPDADVMSAALAHTWRTLQLHTIMDSSTMHLSENGDDDAADRNTQDTSLGNTQHQDVRQQGETVPGGPSNDVDKEFEEQLRALMGDEPASSPTGPEPDYVASPASDTHKESNVPPETTTKQDGAGCGHQGPGMQNGAIGSQPGFINSQVARKDSGVTAGNMSDFGLAAAQVSAITQDPQFLRMLQVVSSKTDVCVRRARTLHLAILHAKYVLGFASSRGCSDSMIVLCRPSSTSVFIVKHLGYLKLIYVGTYCASIPRRPDP